MVHARGVGAFGTFKLYESASDVTKAGVLTDTTRTTPVFIRFSTVLGSRGSADTVRDVRGFAVKFYTEEGNWDIVGNDIPVFFIQDSLKFSDLSMPSRSVYDALIGPLLIVHQFMLQSRSQILKYLKRKLLIITFGTSNIYIPKLPTCSCGHRVTVASLDRFV